MTRRTLLSLLATSLATAANRLPANRSVRWALGANLWNYFPKVPFTEILDVMRDTGFIGLRLTQFPQILTTYDITPAQIEKEVSKRNLHIATISFNGPANDPAQHAKMIADAKAAMNFLKTFGAKHLVVFSPSRLKAGMGDDSFRSMCEGYNRLGEAAGEMGFRAGLHNHLDQMVENAQEVDRCMSMTDPNLFYFSPDTAHLHLAGANVGDTLEKHKQRLMFLDYKDAKWTEPSADVRFANGRVLEKSSKAAKFHSSIYDLGDGEIDFPRCHRVLKQITYRGWICVDLDTARKGPRASYERSGDYVVNKLEGIYV